MMRLSENETHLTTAEELGKVCMLTLRDVAVVGAFLVLIEMIL